MGIKSDMENSNPFDLTKLIASGNIVEKQQYRPDIITSEEKKQLLVGYNKLPYEKWLQIYPGSHIRYVRKDGEMRKGGYIRYIDPEGKYFYITSAPIDIGNAKGWKLPLSGVAEIWIINKNIPVKNNHSNFTDDVNSDIALIKDDIQQLKLEIQRITNDQKRILNLISRSIKRI